MSGGRLAHLSITALGVVFGDISTSPIYAPRECFHGEYGIGVKRGNVLGGGFMEEPKIDNILLASSSFFGLPTDQIIEVGVTLEL